MMNWQDIGNTTAWTNNIALQPSATYWWNAGSETATDGGIG
jgi:hypothetical protein